MIDRTPRLRGILETVLYVTDQDRAERFYSDVMGLRLLSREPGRSLFYRAGDSVFLLFRTEETLKSEKLPPHGASGPVHTCFLAAADEYEAWKKHLETHDVELLGEVQWSRGLTFYFRDPDGNLLEIANADIWPK